MTTTFVGAALPLDQSGLDSVLALLDIGAAELWSVLTVETSGCGFGPDRRPRILFERHKFSRETGGMYDAGYPDISNPVAGGYGKLDTQYQRLERAVALNRAAALDSTSWGIGQIMGFNASLAGYADAQHMITAMMASETNQLLAVAHFLQQTHLDGPLRQRDWSAFAKGYNGSDYAQNQYDTRLAKAYEKYAQGAIPDLSVRAAQMVLTYLGYQPGPVDGLKGARTFAALREFQAHKQLAASDPLDPLDESTLNELLHCIREEHA